MSAWIVGKEHIDVLVHALTSRELVGGLSPDEIGKKLWSENYRSINYRYNEHGRRPPYKYQVPPPGQPSMANVSAVLKQVNCYTYQTCEHPTWRASAPFKWMELLEAALRRQGAFTGYNDGFDTPRPAPDYEAAPWGVNAWETAAMS